MYFFVWNKYVSSSNWIHESYVYNGQMPTTSNLAYIEYSPLSPSKHNAEMVSYNTVFTMVYNL